MSRITFEVTEEQHHTIKALAVLQKKTIKALVIDALFNKKNVPNLETIEAIEDIENRRNLITYETVDMLFEKLRTNTKHSTKG